MFLNRVLAAATSPLSARFPSWAATRAHSCLENVPLPLLSLPANRRGQGLSITPARSREKAGNLGPLSTALDSQ